jgi:uncharacterized protein
MNLEGLLDQLTPELYQTLCRAVETGRWPNGVKLSDSQRGHCIELIIAWDHAHLEPGDRTGYLPPKTSATDNRSEVPEKPLRLLDEPSIN